MELQEQYMLMIDSLKLLSLSFDEQKLCLPNFADVPDDVVSSVENSFLIFPQLVENEMFSIKSIASILRVYNKMQWCLRNVDLDDFSNIEWNKLRELAKGALGQINSSK